MSEEKPCAVQKGAVTACIRLPRAVGTQAPPTWEGSGSFNLRTASSVGFSQGVV